MRATLLTLSSDIRFPFETVFDQSLPRTTLRGNAQAKVDEAIAKNVLENQSGNLFIDTSTSAQRQAECAIGVATCIRPSHPIWSVQLSRYLTVAEMFRCQGLWECDFQHPQAIRDIMKDPAQAQDLAGNAFASTCAQAQLLASLVNACGWYRVQSPKGEEESSVQQFGFRQSLSSGSIGFDDSNTSDAEATQSKSLQQPRNGSIDQFLIPEPPHKRRRFLQAPAAKPFEAGSFYSNGIYKSHNNESADRIYIAAITRYNTVQNCNMYVWTICTVLGYTIQ